MALSFKGYGWDKLIGSYGTLQYITVDMAKKLSEHRIVRALADEVCQRVSRKTIRALQSMANPDGLLSGEDSGLTNTWDEICVQLQGEESYFWGSYEEIVRTYVESFVGELPAHESEAVWLQTPEGDDWDSKEIGEREPSPVVDDDIVNCILNDYVLRAGNDWNNSRIRTYLESRYLDDVPR